MQHLNCTCSGSSHSSVAWVAYKAAHGRSLLEVKTTEQFGASVWNSRHFVQEHEVMQAHRHRGFLGRGVVPLRHVPPPQYCDCGPDWPLLFKVHEI